MSRLGARHPDRVLLPARPWGWRGWLAGLLLAGITAHAASAGEQKNPIPTLKDLQGRKVEVRPGEPVAGSAAKAMEHYRAFLDLNSPDPALRAEALRRLADLNLEASEVERAEREQGLVAGAQGQDAVALYTLLLKSYPDYAGNDAVLYQLARAQESLARPDEALASLDELVARFPASRLIDEAQFRRGEILFSAQRYAEAELAYARVVELGPESTFYEQSLYKDGWSLFKLARNEESLERFGQVLDRKLIHPQDPARMIELAGLSRPERELIEDSLRVASIMFADLEGADSVGAFLDRRGARPYAWLTYASLGDWYMEKERFQDAAHAYQAFVERDPMHAQAPLLQVRAIEAYRKGGFASLVLAGKQQFVEHYGFGSPFWAGRDRTQFPAVVSELKTGVMELARHHHAEGQAAATAAREPPARRKSSAEARAAAEARAHASYLQAARGYRSYLEWFPEEPESPRTRFLLAEVLFESRQFAAAAAEYERAAYDYPPHAQSSEAAYAALLAYEEHEKELTGAERERWHAQGVDSALKFATTWSAHSAAAAVLTRAARDLFDLKDFDRAVETAERVWAREPPASADERRTALTVIAHARFDQSRFAEAETAYLRLRDAIAANDPEQGAITEKLAAAAYKQAEEKQAAGEAGAAEAFLRVVQLAPQSAVARNAEYDAAAELVNRQDWPRAIEVLEGFRRKYPNDALVGEVTRNLAVAYLETRQPGRAATEFERMADAPPEAQTQGADAAQLQREALWRAAELYREAQDRAGARRGYEKFVQRFPQAFEQTLEARQHLVELALQEGDIKTRDRWLTSLIEADRAATTPTDRSRYLAARAALTLAEPQGAAFAAVKLRAPLKKNLALKRQAMERALGAYGRAAEYGVAEVTTAATFSMAELYRTLAQDLLNSERPAKLDAEALEQYDILLEEQAFPFEEKAIEVHAANAARTRDGVYDEWVRRSLAVLAELEPVRYGKVEPQAAALPEEVNALAAQERALRGELENQPPDAPALTRLGLIYRKLGRFQEAHAAYTAALEADADHSPAVLNLGVLYDLYLDDPQRALAAYERYQQLMTVPSLSTDVSGPDLSEDGDSASTARLEGAVSLEVVATWIAELKRRLGFNADPHTAEASQS